MNSEPQQVFPDEVRTHTALHVLKGAVVRVLGEGSLMDCLNARLRQARQADRDLLE